MNSDGRASRAVVGQAHRLGHLLVDAGEPGKRRVLGADQHDHRGVGRGVGGLGEGVGGAEGVERRVAQRRDHRRREVGIARRHLLGEGLALGAVHEQHEEVHVARPAPIPMSTPVSWREPAGEGGDVGAVAGGVLGRGRGAGHHRDPHRLGPSGAARAGVSVCTKRPSTSVYSS